MVQQCHIKCLEFSEMLVCLSPDNSLLDITVYNLERAHSAFIGFSHGWTAASDGCHWKGIARHSSHYSQVVYSNLFFLLRPLGQDLTPGSTLPSSCTCRQVSVVCHHSTYLHLAPVGRCQWCAILIPTDSGWWVALHWYCYLDVLTGFDCDVLYTFQIQAGCLCGQ